MYLSICTYSQFLFLYYKIAAMAITKNLDVGMKNDAGRDGRLIIK